MTVERYAAIDVGSNTVLLLVAERREGGFRPVVERADITRLGRGVDRTRRLDPNAVRETVEVLARYAAEARDLGARAIAGRETGTIAGQEKGTAQTVAGRRWRSGLARCAGESCAGGIRGC